MVIVLAPCDAPPCMMSLKPAPRNADEIDTAMLVESVILDCEHGLFHLVGNLVETRDSPPLLAEFADQHVIRV